ncbi:hypothetical protein IIC68_00660 [archaeon]|nr:hypothetical protein [archaeon]
MGFFDSIKVGWKLTKLSFRILMDEKKLLIFPFVSAIFSVFIGILFFIPFIFVEAIKLSESTSQLGSILVLVVLFLFYLVSSFFATFFNVGLVHSMKSRIEGKDVSIGASIGFAFSRFGVIFKWAFISAIVGLILNALENAARKARGIGGIVISIIRGLIGFAWGVLTFFVIPVIVYENIGVVDTIKRSGQIIKQTWKEAIVVNFGVGLILFPIFLGWIILGTIAVFVTIPIDLLLGIIVGLFFLFGFLVIALFASALGQVYRTLLYLYAVQGAELPGFSDAETQSLFGR